MNYQASYWECSSESYLNLRFNCSIDPKSENYCYILMSIGSTTVLDYAKL